MEESALMSLAKMASKSCQKMKEKEILDSITESDQDETKVLEMELENNLVNYSDESIDDDIVMNQKSIEIESQSSDNDSVISLKSRAKERLGDKTKKIQWLRLRTTVKVQIWNLNLILNQKNIIPKLRLQKRFQIFKETT